jgi:hypothetical protein
LYCGISPLFVPNEFVVHNEADICHQNNAGTKAAMKERSKQQSREALLVTFNQLILHTFTFAPKTERKEKTQSIMYRPLSV